MGGVLHKSIRVRCSARHAFAVFTERTDMWWPPGHRVLGEDASVVFEAREGGRFYVRGADGSEREFGEILAWDPPSSFVYSWFLGSSKELPTEVQIQFLEEGEYTRVEVTHREVESMEGEWPAKAARYERSWDQVLPAFEQCATRGD